MAEEGARRAGVLGAPISHSLSPALHRAAYAGLGLDWTYDAYEVDEQSLPSFLASLDGSWAGLSLTMPLKERALDLVSDVDPVAAAVRSVNTLLPSAAGWRGVNTDIDGIVRSLADAGLVAPRTGMVLGAGATARSAIAALARLGVVEVVVRARRPEAAADAAELATVLGMAAQVGTLEPDAAAVQTVDVVVSTLPGDAAAPWAAAVDSTPAALLDASYHPWPTPLASAWPNALVASGRDMLLWQAVEQVRLMTGQDPDPEAMAAALPR